ncbi:MAG: energy-coupling factor transporter transmembrane protein EcfT, partial [Firmicutes bacterium]|nr:energy-coupling factor transporter transmembrane protein EcfT [Bacillota bacterium]
MLNIEEIYAERVPRGWPWLLAIDARVKIVLVSLALSMTLLVPSSRLALGLTIAILSGLWLLGIKGRHLWSRVGPALLVVAVLFLTRLFFSGGEPLLAVDLLGVQLVLYRDGLEIGLLLSLRVLAGIGLLIL